MESTEDWMIKIKHPCSCLSMVEFLGEPCNDNPSIFYQTGDRSHTAHVSVLSWKSSTNCTENKTVWVASSSCPGPQLQILQRGLTVNVWLWFYKTINVWTYSLKEIGTQIGVAILLYNWSFQILHEADSGDKRNCAPAMPNRKMWTTSGL